MQWERCGRGRAALGIVTHGYGGVQRSRIHASGIKQYFETIVISEDVGHTKPDPEIFRITLSEMGLTHADALYIGDSIEDGYRGALLSRIDFCLYDPKNIRLVCEVEPVTRIATLDGLTNLIS
jgi:putative hydrolase of the HAD superfamily